MRDAGCHLHAGNVNDQLIGKRAHVSWSLFCSIIASAMCGFGKLLLLTLSLSLCISGGIERYALCDAVPLMIMLVPVLCRVRTYNREMRERISLLGIKVNETMCVYSSVASVERERV